MTNALKKLSNKIVQLYHSLKDYLSVPINRKKIIAKVGMFVVNLLKYIIMIGLSFIIVYPLLLQISVAIRHPVDINDPTVMWIPKSLSLKNFEIAMIALHYWPALGSSLMNSVFVFLFTVISTALAGYSFARLKFKGSGFLFVLALFTIVVPQTMISLPLYIDLANANLLGKKYVLYLMAALGSGIKSGIFIYLFRQFFKGIPYELEEAAYVDGANVFQVFYKVMLPNARSGIITVALLSFVWQWNDFYFTNLFFVNGQADVFTLATQQQSILHGLQDALKEANIWQLMGQDITQNSLFVSMILNTAGILVMLPVLIMYFFVQKLFVEGIERSGIVG